jgi:hypothetical protein
MSRFWKRFLREGQRFFGRGPKPQIWLGAFGKHPGWDDHIDDIGLETESLLLAKQILYVDGIGGQVNSGEWERLDGARRLAEFKHIFLWKRGDAFLASGADDGNVVFYDVRARRAFKPLREHPLHIWHVAFAPDGGRRPARH